MAFRLLESLGSLPDLMYSFPCIFGSRSITFSYDGTSWTILGSNMARTGNMQFFGSAGSQTSALAFGGNATPASTEEFTGGPVNVNKTISFS